MTAHSEGSFVNGSGARITYLRWQPQTPRAVVLLVHGMAEHAGRYQPLAQKLCDANIAVCAPDLPGHGRSEGKRCHIGRFEEFLTTVAELRALIGTRFPGLPVFLLGHSMGGLVATATVLESAQDYRGLVLSGPALQTELTPPWLQIQILRLLAVVWPSAPALGLDAAGVSRDPAVVKNYVEDPLNHTGKVSARMVAELFARMGDVQQRFADIHLPLLVLHGGADSMTAPAGSRALVQAAASEDKQLEVYDGLYHEIFNEPEGPQIMDQVVAWLLAHLPSKG